MLKRTHSIIAITELVSKDSPEKVYFKSGNKYLRAIDYKWTIGKESINTYDLRDVEFYLEEEND